YRRSHRRYLVHGTHQVEKTFLRNQPPRVSDREGAFETTRDLTTSHFPLRAIQRSELLGVDADTRRHAGHLPVHAHPRGGSHHPCAPSHKKIGPSKHSTVKALTDDPGDGPTMFRFCLTCLNPEYGARFDPSCRRQRLKAHDRPWLERAVDEIRFGRFDELCQTTGDDMSIVRVLPPQIEFHQVNTRCLPRSIRHLTWRKKRIVHDSR